jgi:hypothetical protein
MPGQIVESESQLTERLLNEVNLKPVTFVGVPIVLNTCTQIRADVSGKRKMIENFPNVIAEIEKSVDQKRLSELFGTSGIRRFDVEVYAKRKVYGDLDYRPTFSRGPIGKIIGNVKASAETNQRVAVPPHITPYNFVLDFESIKVDNYDWRTAVYTGEAFGVAYYCNHPTCFSDCHVINGLYKGTCGKYTQEKAFNQNLEAIGLMNLSNNLIREAQKIRETENLFGKGI